MAKNSPRKVYRKKLALLFGSTAAICFSFIAVANHIIVSGLNIGTELITFILKLSIPSAVILGYIGYMIGIVVEAKPKKKKSIISNFQTMGDPSAYQINSIFSAAPEGEASLEGTGSMFGEGQTQDPMIFGAQQEGDPTTIGGV
ncbi:hypothetical protein IKA15_03270 [bacterium]|nr:hypothetical protein [bacterium]